MLELPNCITEDKEAGTTLGLQGECARTHTCTHTHTHRHTNTHKLAYSYVHTGTHRYTHTHMLPLHGIDLPSLIDGAQSKIDNKYSTSIFITPLCRGCCYSLPWCSSEHCACPTLRSSILTGVCVCVCVCLCMCVCVCVRASAYECVLLISFIW